MPTAAPTVMPTAARGHSPQPVAVGDASHPLTQVGSPPPATGWQSPPTSGPRSSGNEQRIVRYGPGVPGSAPGSAATPAATAPTAEEVWRHGLPANGQRPPHPLRRWAGTGLTVVLLIASAVVIYLRLHHPPLGVTGASITQVTSGCTVHVTGRISTTGGSGIVSYEWTFQPQLIAPQPMSQTVAAGQSAVYVAAAIDGQEHGSLRQTVTLRVLGPGPGHDASAPVAISC
jgi:hypothetical protein